VREKHIYPPNNFAQLQQKTEKQTFNSGRMVCGFRGNMAQGKTAYVPQKGKKRRYDYQAISSWPYESFLLRPDLRSNSGSSGD
jgi:hypothetical protein